jgi:ATP synthase protein I
MPDNPDSGRHDSEGRGADQEKISVAASGTSNPESHRGYNAGMAVFSYIIGGILVWSLIGWGLDILLGTHWIVLAGIFVGLVGGFYLSFARRLTQTRNRSVGGPGPAKSAGNSEQQ